VRQSRYIFVVATCVLNLGFTYWQDQNSPPTITISIQENGKTFQWNSIVPYSIAVSDAEDGTTEFNEISVNEVVLVAQYLPDSNRIKKNYTDALIVHHDAVLAISKALCFNCHAAKAKLIGPSFEQVAARYKNDTEAVERLTKRIIDGSTGIWSDLKMPPHPELAVQDVKEMVTWILGNNSDPYFTYSIGVEGALRTREKPADPSSAGVYVLTAIYMDHGMNANNGLGAQTKRGHHTLVLRNPQ
jgi:cytochrome c